MQLLFFKHALVIILFVQNLFQLDHRLQWDKRPRSYAPYESTTEYTDEDTESYDNTMIRMIF